MGVLISDMELPFRREKINGLVKKSVLVIGGLVFVFLALFLRDRVSADFSRESLDNILSHRGEWGAEMMSLGEEKFLEVLRSRYQENNNRHTVAHIYGELLYELRGADGLAFCDDTFSYGCYHAFFGQVLSREGLDVLPKLDGACVEKFGELDSGCQHGIGHGLLQYLGTKNLNEALFRCASLPKRGTSCFEGVFMEFNFPAEVEGVVGRVKQRQLTNDPFYPCEDVETAFQGSCYYELPRLWERVFESNFSEIGRLCQQINEIQMKQKCFAGVGNVATVARDHEVQAIVEECSLMPTRMGEVACLVEASNALFSVEEHRAKAPLVCEKMTKEERRSCRE